MKAILATSRPQAACRSTAAPRPRPHSLRATARPSLRTHSLASDVGKYLSEAASQIFHPQNESDVPWVGNAFTGKIVHHEETARLKALERDLDAAVKDIESSLDQSDAEERVDEKSAPPPGEDSVVGGFVMTSIQRVFGNNFKGDETEPKTWSSGGYASSGRHRSQRALRHEYERLQRFRTVVKKTIETAEGGNKA